MRLSLGPDRSLGRRRCRRLRMVVMREVQRIVIWVETASWSHTPNSWPTSWRTSKGLGTRTWMAARREVPVGSRVAQLPQAGMFNWRRSGSWCHTCGSQAGAARWSNCSWIHIFCTANLIAASIAYLQEKYFLFSNGGADTKVDGPEDILCTRESISVPTYMYNVLQAINARNQLFAFWNEVAFDDVI